MFLSLESLFVFALENIQPSGNFKWEKTFFKLLCWNVNEKFTIDRAGYQSKKQ